LKLSASQNFLRNVSAVGGHLLAVKATDPPKKDSAGRTIGNSASNGLADERGETLGPAVAPGSAVRVEEMPPLAGSRDINDPRRCH